MNAPRALAVDFSELCIALAAEGCWYLDLSTGDVILVSAEFDPGEYNLSIADIEGDAQRFVRVPTPDPTHLLEDMRAFAKGLSDVRLTESLELAMEAPRPDRRFKAVLDWLPEIKERWHAWRLARTMERAQTWLSKLGVAAEPRADLA